MLPVEPPAKDYGIGKAVDAGMEGLNKGIDWGIDKAAQAASAASPYLGKTAEYADNFLNKYQLKDHHVRNAANWIKDKTASLEDTFNSLSDEIDKLVIPDPYSKGYRLNGTRVQELHDAAAKWLKNPTISNENLARFQALVRKTGDYIDRGKKLFTPGGLAEAARNVTSPMLEGMNRGLANMVGRQPAKIEPPEEKKPSFWDFLNRFQMQPQVQGGVQPGIDPGAGGGAPPRGGGGGGGWGGGGGPRPPGAPGGGFPPLGPEVGGGQPPPAAPPPGPPPDMGGGGPPAIPQGAAMPQPNPQLPSMWDTVRQTVSPWIQKLGALGIPAIGATAGLSAGVPRLLAGMTEPQSNGLEAQQIISNAYDNQLINDEQYEQLVQYARAHPDEPPAWVLNMLAEQQRVAGLDTREQEAAQRTQEATEYYMGEGADGVPRILHDLEEYQMLPQEGMNVEDGIREFVQQGGQADGPALPLIRFLLANNYITQQDVGQRARDARLAGQHQPQNPEHFAPNNALMLNFRGYFGNRDRAEYQAEYAHIMDGLRLDEIDPENQDIDDHIQGRWRYLQDMEEDITDRLRRLENQMDQRYNEDPDIQEERRMGRELADRRLALEDARNVLGNHLRQLALQREAAAAPPAQEAQPPAQQAGGRTPEQQALIDWYEEQQAPATPGVHGRLQDHQPIIEEEEEEEDNLDHQAPPRQLLRIGGGQEAGDITEVDPDEQHYSFGFEGLGGRNEDQQNWYVNLPPPHGEMYAQNGDVWVGTSRQWRWQRTLVRRRGAIYQNHLNHFEAEFREVADIDDHNLDAVLHDLRRRFNEEAQKMIDDFEDRGGRHTDPNDPQAAYGMATYLMAMNDAAIRVLREIRDGTFRTSERILGDEDEETEANRLAYNHVWVTHEHREGPDGRLEFRQTDPERWIKLPPWFVPPDEHHDEEPPHDREDIQPTGNFDEGGVGGLDQHFEQVANQYQVFQDAIRNFRFDYQEMYDLPGHGVLHIGEDFNVNIERPGHEPIRAIDVNTPPDVIDRYLRTLDMFTGYAHRDLERVDRDDPQAVFGTLMDGIHLAVAGMRPYQPQRGHPTPLYRDRVQAAALAGRFHAYLQVAEQEYQRLAFGTQPPAYIAPQHGGHIDHDERPPGGGGGDVAGGGQPGRIPTDIVDGGPQNNAMGLGRWVNPRDNEEMGDVMEDGSALPLQTDAEAEAYAAHAPIAELGQAIERIMKAIEDGNDVPDDQRRALDIYMNGMAARARRRRRGEAAPGGARAPEAGFIPTGGDLGRDREAQMGEATQNTGGTLPDQEARDILVDTDREQRAQARRDALRNFNRGRLAGNAPMRHFDWPPAPPAEDHEIEGADAGGADTAPDVVADIDRTNRTYTREVERIQHRITAAENAALQGAPRTDANREEALRAVGGLLNNIIEDARNAVIDQPDIGEANLRLQAALDTATRLLPNLRTLQPDIDLTRSGRFNLPGRREAAGGRYTTALPPRPMNVRGALPGRHNQQGNLRLAHTYLQLVQMIDDTRTPGRHIDPLPPIPGLDYEARDYDFNAQGEMLRDHGALTGYTEATRELDDTRTEPERRQQLLDRLLQLRNRLEGQARDLIRDPMVPETRFDPADARETENRASLGRAVIGWEDTRAPIYRNAVRALDVRLRDLGITRETRNNIMDQAVRWVRHVDDAPQPVLYHSPLYAEELARAGMTAEDAAIQGRMTPVDRVNEIIDNAHGNRREIAEILGDGTRLPPLPIHDLIPDRHRNRGDLDRARYIELILKSGKYHDKFTREELGTYPADKLQEILTTISYTREGKMAPRRAVGGMLGRRGAAPAPPEDLTDRQQELRAEIAREMADRDEIVNRGDARRAELAPLRVIFDEGPPTIGNMLRDFDHTLDDYNAAYPHGTEEDALEERMLALMDRIRAWRPDDDYIARVNAQRLLNHRDPLTHEEEEGIRRLHVTDDDLNEIRLASLRRT
jgi:hypothetical protein